MNFFSSDITKHYHINELPQILNNDAHELIFVNYNIRSFFKNITGFCTIMQSASFEPDILILTETWLKEDNHEFANIRGYEGFHTIRTSGRSGGVSIFCRDNLVATCLPDFCITNSFIESCTLRISRGKT